MEPNNSIPTLSPAERVKAEMDKLLGYAPEDKEEEVLPPHGVYKDDIGRKHNMDEIQAQGFFYTKPDRSSVVTAVLVIMLPLAALIVLAMLFLRSFFLFTGIDVFPIIVVEIIVYLLIGFFVFYQCATKKHGPLHSYKADGRAFYVTVNGKGKEQILFKDVLSVEYSPTRMFWGYRGYDVDIVTTYGTIHYDYIFPRFRHSIIPENLPFDIIKKNIPKSENDKQNYRFKR